MCTGVYLLMKPRPDALWIIAMITLAVGLVLPGSVRGEKIPAKLLRADFQIMRHALEEAHGGIYRYTCKADMDRTFDRAYQKIDRPMTALEFWRLAAPVVANIKCGHTYLFFPKAVQTQMVTTLPLFPMVTRIVNDRLYGYQDLANAESPLEGAELLSINGVPARKLLNNFRTVCYTGDGNTATAKDYRITHYGDFRFYLYGFGIESPFQVVYRDKDGKRHSTTLAGMEQSAASEAWDRRNPGLANAPNADFKFLDGDRIAVMTIRHWYQYADEDRKLEFSDFLKASFAQIHQDGTTNLIIDVRDDSGGLDVPVVELFAYLWDQPFHVYRDINCNASDFDFLKYDEGNKSLPADLISGTVKGADGKFHVIKQAGLDVQQPLQPHYAGRVLALMNAGSFSSSTEFLTLLHFYKRAKFIGEEPAGAYYGYTCGRMVSPILPNSKLELDFGILTFNLDVSGYKHPDRGVMPDYPVTYTIADLLAGRDKDMELALSLAREKQQ
jgi:C-terminal processing protease CtpA/Prc